MDRSGSPRKKPKSPGLDPHANINIKTSVTCTNVPEALFDTNAAKKHFVKFGRVLRIRLFPRKSLIIVEYDQPLAVERAVLNAGAYDGFMFDVTRTKARVRKRSKKEDDPDWLPDPEVEEELSAMSGAPTYRISRQKPMEIEAEMKLESKPKTVKKSIIKSPVRSKLPIREKKLIASSSQAAAGTDTPVVSSHTSLSTAEAASELHQLRSKVSLTADEKWRILDARDRILRAWGGAGSRVKVGGATIGTCPDMCPEKELLHRQAEHQVMTLETVPGSDGALEPWRAVKQYSRSSADQEMPMCYELRPPAVLVRTTAYLLREIADTKRQVTLADWFHFMWDRFRGIRKDITQQALCCSESIYLVEMCARFHAHCAARLADLEYTQFDQKLNTDNLTKCLQTLKHMYHDVGPGEKPREAEFRGYIALLNLGDANFWWEIQQLPMEIQKSADILFAMKIFNALDNNNYVRFFRLVRDEATYLQACILLRYFNDVRARALARIVKAYAPRGQSKYPAEDLMNTLAFESVESMKSFVNHYGLRFGKDDTELVIVLDRNQFIEDSDPYPMGRAVNLIESKRHCSVGEVVAGGTMPSFNYTSHTPHSSFTADGKLKESALVAEDQEYNTINDSNKDVAALKAEIQRLSKGGRITDRLEPKLNVFVKPESRNVSPGRPKGVFAAPITDSPSKNVFSFKPAITVAPTDVIKNSPERLEHETKSLFSFSKPQETPGNEMDNIFNVFGTKGSGDNHKLFGRESNENKDPNTNFQFKKPDQTSLFKRPEDSTFSFIQTAIQSNNTASKPLFGSIENKNIFADDADGSQKTYENQNIFTMAKNVSASKGGSIFAQPAHDVEATQVLNIFGAPRLNHFSQPKNIFAKPDDAEPKAPFAPNGNVTGKLSPGSLFKAANSLGEDGKSYSIFQSKNKIPSVAENIFKSVTSATADVYDFDQNDDELRKQLEIQRQNEETIRAMERQVEEKLNEEAMQKELIRQEEEKLKEEERKRIEELKLLEEKRKREEQMKQEELKRKLEEEKMAEMKRKAEEEKRQFLERVDIESAELINEMVDEVGEESVREITKEELHRMKCLMSLAGEITEDIWMGLCDEICYSEMKAEKFRTDNIMKKWFSLWKSQFVRNYERRSLLEDTPVWLTEHTPLELAAHLRRDVENAALKNMNDIHRGYKFTGELRQLPAPETYNITEIIRSSLLKRMKQIGYPYDKCFFWKVTVVSPGANKWLYRKIETERWILDAFSDKKKHETSDTLIRVEKQSWNHLMDFAVSVSLAKPDDKFKHSEALEGTNGLLIYVNELDNNNFFQTVDGLLKQKYPYQVIPVAVLVPKIMDITEINMIEETLSEFLDKNMISGFRLLLVDPDNLCQSLNMCTKSAVKWLAKNYPQIPPLEIDYLKSICQRYLGNEIWLRLKMERDSRMNTVLKDLNKVVHCYNTAVEKLSDAITNEDLFNYPCFPLEFKDYLDHSSPYPKPYEFVPANAKNSENASAIRDFLQKLKLPNSTSPFYPVDVVSMQQQIRTYCNQIQWFENPEEVVCKVVAILPNQLSDLNQSCEEFTEHYEQYDMIDFLRVVVYEKIRRLNNFENRYAVYEKSAVNTYSNAHWLYEIDAVSSIKHKALEYEDELDMFIQAKRRKIELDSMEYLMLEDKDSTMAEESLEATKKSISRFSGCTNALRKLEEQIDLERQKSMDLDNLLKSALYEV